MSNSRVRQRTGSSTAGQGLLEYVLIIALVAVIVIAGLTLTGVSVGNVFSQVSAQVQGDVTSVHTPTPIPKDITVNVVDANGGGIPNVRVYAFSDRGRYLGHSGRSDGAGKIHFDLGDGGYRFRADYQTRQHWSAPITWPRQAYAKIQTGQRAFTIKVAGAAGAGISNVRVYAFNGHGRYTGAKGRTGADGVVKLNLTDGDFKFRADYQARQFWSAVVTSPGVSSVTVNTGQRPFSVKVADATGAGISNVRVYAFTGNGRYIGVSGRTGANGVIKLNLADGSLKFRADYQSRQFWSAVVTSPAVTSATVKTGQRPFSVKVTEAAGAGISNVRVYAFTGNGRYTGVKGRTGAGGVVKLNLANGDLKFRADYQSRQFWSAVVTSPGVTSATVNTGQRHLSVKVDDAAGAGIPNVRVYAFTGSGRYTGAKGRTGAGGVVKLNLANGDLKFRAYYQAKQFWSSVVSSPAVTSATVKTGQRPVTVHVANQGGTPQANVRVYAFTTSNRYVGVNGRTGAPDGQVVLNLSDGGYRFRANTRSGAFWSADITTPASTSASVTIP